MTEKLKTNLKKLIASADRDRVMVYAFVGKIGKVRWKDRIIQHLPGAVFTTIGWMLFSYGFAIYIHFFPSK